MSLKRVIRIVDNILSKYPAGTQSTVRGLGILHWETLSTFDRAIDPDRPVLEYEIQEDHQVKFQEYSQLQVTLKVPKKKKKGSIIVRAANPE